MPYSLIAAIASQLQVSQTEAQAALDDFIRDLHQHIKSQGHAELPGVGVFQSKGKTIILKPDDSLSRAVNHRFLGLDPVIVEIAAPQQSSEVETAAIPEEETAPIVEDTVETAPPQPATMETLEEPLFGSVKAPSDEQEEGDWDHEQEATEKETTHAAKREEFEPPVSPLPSEDREKSISEPENPPRQQEWEKEEKETVSFYPYADQPEVEEPDLQAGDDVAWEDKWAMPKPKEVDWREHEDIFTPEWQEEDAPVENDTPDSSPVPAFVEEDVWLEEEKSDERVAETVDAQADEPQEEFDVYEQPEAEPADIVEEEDETLPDDTVLEPELPVTYVAAPDMEMVSEDEPDLSAAEATSTLASTRRDANVPPPPHHTYITPPATRSRRRRSPVPWIAAGILLIAIVGALGYYLLNEPGEPIARAGPIAVEETPPETFPSDTTSMTTLPADTAAAGIAEPPVTPAEEIPSEPTANASPLRGEGGISKEDGGWTLIVGSRANRAGAETLAEQYRNDGFRSSVVYGSFGGSTRYRVGVGQFPSVEAAAAAREELPDRFPSDAWVMPVRDDQEVF